MSETEYKIRKLLDDATFYIKNAVEDETYHEKSRVCLEQADKELLDNTRQSFVTLSSELIVMLVEVSLMSDKRDERAERILDIFFQRINQEDQFFCRALLCQATIEERKIAKQDYKGDENLKQVMKAFTYIQRSIEICTRAENKAKYGFMVYNASIKTWHILRGMMRAGWSRFIVDILEKVSNLLEEMDDSDFNWRCRYLSALCKALADAEKKPESIKILDKLVDLTKKKGDCIFQESLFRSRIHMNKDNAGVLGNIKKETETGEDTGGYKALYAIQTIKSGIVPEPQVEKELQLLLSQIAPSSVSDDPNAAATSGQQNQKISPILQDRVAECGRMAIKYGLIQYAESACVTVARARQGSLRAKILTEYTKSELLLKKPSKEIDPKTGMKLNTIQRQIEDFERRVEALKIIDRAMIANKKLQDADVTIEGCILIWNIGIPLLKSSMRSHIYKPFQAAASALELLEANESQLRVCLHLELAKYEIEQDFLSKATMQLKKALRIDYSAVKKNLGIDLTEDDNPDDFARPFDRAIKFLLKKLNLKTNLYGGGSESIHELIILDVENAKTTKNAQMRETLLKKALKQLLEYEEPEFEVREEDNLVEEEIKEQERTFHLKLVRERKERVLIACEISKLALEENLVEISFQSGTLCIKDAWDAQKDLDLVIAQSEAQINLARVHVEFLLDDEIEIGHGELVTLDDDQDEREFTADEKEKFAKWKEIFVEHIIQAVRLGTQARQSWLIFNASIEFWNNYLPIFKLPGFYEKLHPTGPKAMQECFEAMNGCFESAQFSQDAVDYELNKKVMVFSNLSVLLARYFEFKAENNEAVRICDTLLTKQLPSHLRKTFDSIKARVTKQVSNLAAVAGGAAKGGKEPAAAGKKGQAAEVVKPKAGPSETDILTSEVLSYLELIQNGQKDMIQKALDTMNMWQPNEQEEIELELNVELWCRLGRLAIGCQTNSMYKVALYCADVAIKNGDEKAKKRQYMQIPVTRLRWYAVAEALYGEALFLLLDTQKQEKESQDKLLHASVARFVESCNIGSTAGISYLVLESAKSMWNALLGILDAPNNRKLLIKPMSLVHGYLKKVQESSDPDFLALFYSALFQCISEQKDWHLGEKITEEAFTYVPQTHQKVLWEAKMNFLSKLGKNVLSAISNMKESNASLMAQVWVRLARSSQNTLEQHSAYNKAIEILRKEESIEVVEVLIEYSEWMHRQRYDPQDVEDMLLLAVDFLMDVEPGWDDEDDEIVDEADDGKTKKTAQSRSSKQSKAMSRAQSKAMTKKSGAKSMKKSVANKSKVSKATMRSRSMRSHTTRTSKKTTTALQKRQEEEGQPMYLNCSHFDKLIRIHSMLAMLSPDANKQREYALDGHFFVMKMWEQSIFSLNAQIFFEQNAAELNELGYNPEDQYSRREFYSEVINGGEMQIPSEFQLPSKPEDWISFEVPQEYFSRSAEHEDKIMIAKYTYVKPELTFLHLQKIAKLLDEHYFHIQLLPVLKLLELFSGEVFNDKIYRQQFMLHRSRLLYNMGLSGEAKGVLDKVKEDAYNLTEEECKVNFEKIKALKNPLDNEEGNRNIPFAPIKAEEPFVIENIKIHESWLSLASELLKWGDFEQAKSLAAESSKHARILQDQSGYARSMLVLSEIAYLEGESAAALKLAMASHRYASDIEFIEEAIVTTFNLLFKFDKLDDCEALLAPALNMLVDLRGSRELELNQGSSMLETKTKTKSDRQTILPLEFAISTVLVLRATLSLKMAQNSRILKDEKDMLMAQSFEQAEQFEEQLRNFGFKQIHMDLLLKYTNLLWQEVTMNAFHDLESLNRIKEKLQQCALFLLKAQEYLTNQVYYIGVHQETIKQEAFSLPILRILGVTKLRIAQVNTTIGIIKSQKANSSGSVMSKSASGKTNDAVVAKVLSNFMDAISKQISAEANLYEKNMNRYEKSISILYTALNLLHPNCEEYPEIQVEIAKNRRLLAVNKKHLRGQWRQDAIEVDKVNMVELSQNANEANPDRKDQLDAMGLEGEINDNYVNYKSEMLRTFIELLDNKIGSGSTSADEEKVSTFQRIVSRLGTSRIDNILANFAIEFAEGRANLNKEQAFYYLSLFQYAVNRQHLEKSYTTITTEKHPDTIRRRGMETIRNNFSYTTCPGLPPQYETLHSSLLEKSKPFQVLHDLSSLDQVKENLPGQSGYLILQMSDDRRYLYVGYTQVNKERKFTYFMDKVPVSTEARDEIIKSVARLATLKNTMQKTPITITEDLEILERESEEEMRSIINQMEAFFEPVTSSIRDIIYPKPKEETEDAEIKDADTKGKDNKSKKEDPKKAPPKAPPKAGKAGGAQSEVGSYESPLPLTAGGIESIVIMADQMFEALPVEALNVFNDVQVVTRDFNLHVHLHRLKSVGHKAELHNNHGISKEELKYIIDLPQQEALIQQGGNFVEGELPKLLPGSTWEGILTHKKHVPSIGEWQSQIANSSFFAYFSMTCLLHKFPAELIADLSIFNKCKAMAIFDRLNSFKALVDRNVLTSKHFSPDEQPMQQAALFTLCGVSTIVINHWSTKPEDAMVQLEDLMRGTFQEGSYLGSVAFKKGHGAKKRPMTQGSVSQSMANKSSTKNLKAGEGEHETQPGLDSQMMASHDGEAQEYAIHKHNMVTIGVPFLRAQ